MLLSTKSAALTCVASVILGAALIAARTHYSEYENLYKANDGNYYAYPRQGIDQLPEEDPSFFGWVIQGIRRILGIAPNNEQRQAESFLGSLFSSGGWILPATGVAVAGIYREEISDIIEEIVDPSTAKPTANTTAKPDPCNGVTCPTGSGLTPISNLGICQCLCGTSAATAFGIGVPSDVNVCDSGVKKCGKIGGTIEAACTVATNALELCRAPNNAVPTLGGDATCQCNTADHTNCHALSGNLVNYCKSDGTCGCGMSGAACSVSGETCEKTGSTAAAGVTDALCA